MTLKMILLLLTMLVFVSSTFSRPTECVTTWQVVRVQNANCYDRNGYCRSWAYRGECRRNPAYMRINCCRSCGGGGVSSTCYDSNRLCYSWARKNECRRNPRYMYRYCRRSCGRCSTTTKKNVVTCKVITTIAPPRTKVWPSPLVQKVTTKELPSPPLPEVTTEELATQIVPKKSTEKLATPPLPEITTEKLATPPVLEVTTEELATPPLPNKGTTKKISTSPVPKAKTTNSIGSTAKVKPITEDIKPPPLPEDCNEVAIGLESNRIPDAAFSSSSDESPLHSASQARLNMEINKNGIGAWCAKEQDHKQYLQIDLGDLKTIKAVVIQGYNDTKTKTKFVKTFSMAFSEDLENWNDYVNTDAHDTVKIFDGNTDGNTAKKVKFESPLEARSIRIIPLEWNNGICLRIEIYACP